MGAGDAGGCAACVSSDISRCVPGAERIIPDGCCVALAPVTDLGEGGHWALSESGTGLPLGGHRSPLEGLRDGGVCPAQIAADIIKASATLGIIGSRLSIGC